ncbi:MAG: FHA domain-containing protein [Acidimicrobiia bacterium]|nr:FHA domain-containing protein [Acidimicrobiia bacterium]MDH3463317.1 FHA domain-containing protein [Acidimicrobiia bacterium]
MNIARSLERRLERLLEGVFGRVFSGRLHASEIAGRVAREADLTRFEHESGPATANQYTLTFNPIDIDDEDSSLAASLTDTFAEYVIESGLRLVGPPRVIVWTSGDVVPGSFLCHPEIVPGTEAVWARLVGSAATYPIRHNRSVIGRSDAADVTIPADDVSRVHALIWRAEGSIWIKDLGSINGTVVDSMGVGQTPVQISTGSIVRLGTQTFRFLLGSDA